MEYATINPATGEHLVIFPAHIAVEVEAALTTAQKAYGAIPIKQIGNTTLYLTEGARACEGFARLPGIKFYFLPADKICFDLC
jgi:hypothetical protein